MLLKALVYQDAVNVPPCILHQIIIFKCMIKEDNHFYDYYVIIMPTYGMYITKKVYQKNLKTENKHLCLNKNQSHNLISCTFTIFIFKGLLINGHYQDSLIQYLTI